jgi:hypothetical protein
LDGSGSSLSLGSYSSHECGCDGRCQTYYRFKSDFIHVNKTNIPILFKLSNDVGDLNCKWGLKEQIILIKPCHNYCL